MLFLMISSFVYSRVESGIYLTHLPSVSAGTERIFKKYLIYPFEYRNSLLTAPPRGNRKKPFVRIPR